MKALVCGGRNYGDREAVFAALDRLAPTSIIHGGATGADSLADEWASTTGTPCTTYYANWQVHGRAAGPIRNAEMLAEMPDVVVAFPGGKGTADMVRQARAKGVRVIEPLSDGGSDG